MQGTSANGSRTEVSAIHSSGRFVRVTQERARAECQVQRMDTRHLEFPGGTFGGLSPPLPARFAMWIETWLESGTLRGEHAVTLALILRRSMQSVRQP